jgi:tetratricopeptide (TPR) repeat protein
MAWKVYWVTVITADEIAAKAQLHIGLCFEKLGTQEAEKAFQSAIRLKPDLVKALTGLANLLRSKGRTGEADSCSERVRRLTEQKQNTHLAYSSNSEGLNLMQQGKLEEADLTIEKAKGKIDASRIRS